MESNIGLIFLKYFYLIAVVLNVFNMLIMLTMQRSNKREFLQLFSVVFVSTFLVFGIMQLLGGYKTPLYIISGRFEIFKVISWAYGLGVIGFLFYKNNFDYIESIELTLSHRSIKIGNKNLIVNLILVMTIVIVMALIMFDVYSQIELLF